tara:strand:- start:180 stop:410 length:231 start_codon:yes stop_codon:yes gene_type:complete
MNLLFLALTALAGEPEPIIIYKEKTEIDFEALDIEGKLKKPQGAIISERREIFFNPLVQIRENWSYEMTQSINDIQ